MILRDMHEGDLEHVLRIEHEVHSHPWTRGNFSDALKSGYPCKVYASPDGREMFGYAIMMLAVDEAELLDIAIAAEHQRHGWGRKLLNEMAIFAKHRGMQRMVLEVRASNLPAISLYRSSGFIDIGLRRAYYPAENGREDAILMGKGL